MLSNVQFKNKMNYSRPLLDESNITLFKLWYFLSSKLYFKIILSKMDISTMKSYIHQFCFQCKRN